MLDHTSRVGAIAVLVASSALTFVSPAKAQTAGAVAEPNQSDQSSLQEVLVTAERRSSNLQETPLALSVVSGGDLAQRDIHTMQDLAFSVPTLDMGVSEGQAHPAIRGIGASDIIWGADPRVGFYLDDVYVPRPEEQLGVLFDIDQVQVLNGPQGTLYGRNATGGALLISSRKPTSTPTGYLDLTAGNYGEFDADGALSGPLSNTLSARIAFQTIDHSGYGKNLLTGADIDNAHQRSLRLSFLWDPVEDFNFLLQTDYHRENDRNYAEHFGGLASLATPPTEPTGLAFGGFVPPVDSRN